MLLALDYFRQLLPLLFLGIDTGRVVSASVKQDLGGQHLHLALPKSTYDRSIFGLLDVLFHSLKVKADRLLVEVSIYKRSPGASPTDIAELSDQ